MTANELRIGNLIKGIGTNIEWIVEGFEGDCIYSNDGWRYLSHFEPIPLTEEWLVKFGFKSDNNEPNEIYSIDISTDERYDYVSTLRIIVMDDFCLVDIMEKGTHPRADESIVTLKSIQHVHSLQNLIFALTGEELILKK